MNGVLTDPHGHEIGFTDRYGESTHRCREGCRLHLPCCDEYARTGPGPWVMHTDACKAGTR